MDINRREFIVIPAAVEGGALLAAQTAVPWQRKIRRLGQTNMTEHDPAVLDVEQWADYWASLKVDAVLVSVTGILAFYQTKVPYHRKDSILNPLSEGFKIVTEGFMRPYAGAVVLHGGRDRRSDRKSEDRLTR